LVDLFTTIGKVERAEIQYEGNGRSRGTGVVEFDSPETGETAICKYSLLALLLIGLLICLAKFTGYQYGGRPLGITFVRYAHPSAPGDGGDVAEDPAMTQDQMM
jgi:RNA recognition motif-containing protein